MHSEPSNSWQLQNNQARRLPRYDFHDRSIYHISNILGYILILNIYFQIFREIEHTKIETIIENNTNTCIYTLYYLVVPNLYLYILM